MAMPLSVAISTSLRKYRRKKLRTFFGIAPTVLLFIFIVLLSGIAVSADKFIHDRVLSKIEQKEEVFELSKQFGSGTGPAIADPNSDAEDPTNYSLDDLAKVKKISHVVDVQPERPLPNMLVATQSLVAGKELQLTNLVGAPEDLGRLYNAVDFSYTPGQPIPIIINRSIFNYSSLDFAGKTDIALTQKDMADQAKQRELSPLKTKFLTDDYQKSALLGKTFSATAGGLPRVAAYLVKTTNSKGDYTQTFHSFTPAEKLAEVKKQRDKITPYWDFDKLGKGVELQFRIAGFSESQDNANEYIPLEASSLILQQLYDLQRAARTKTVMPQELYNLNYSGLRLSKSNQLSANSGGYSPYAELLPAKYQYEGQSPTMPEPIAIPGWLYKATTKNDAVTLSEVDGFIIKPDSLAIKALAVRVDDATNAAKAQKELVAAGYPEAQNTGGLTSTLRGLRKGLSTALFWIVVVLTFINSLILISTVSRTVADAQREIGVFRALGARKRDIRKLYVVYSSLQTALGIGAGLLLGLLAVWPVSNFLASKAKLFLPIDSSSGEGAFGFNLKVSPADLQHFDWQRIIIYSLALLFVTIIVSLIPAARAARISPVEAIRRAD